MRLRTLAALALATAFLITALFLLPSPEVQIVGFATSLAGRSRAQRHNAVLAADALDGRVLPPGAEFSFNKAVKSWSADAGYVKAPVSYNGELVPAFGGGVCQTSTTLYNAALRAGLPIVERHHHVFAPHYCIPGQDAAVAYPNLDLRFRNPYPFALRLRTSARGDCLRVEWWGAHLPEAKVFLEPRILETRLPRRASRRLPHRGSGRNPGMVGYRVVMFRVFSRDGKITRRERLSDDSYPAMDRVIGAGVGG